MQKLMVIENGTISHSVGSDTSGGTFTITSAPSLTVLAEGQGVYKGVVNFTFSGGNSTETFGGTGAITPGTVKGNGSISGTAIKSYVNGEKSVLEGDSGQFSTLTGTFVPSAPPNTPVPETLLPPTAIEFSSAGQSKVFAS